MKYSILFVIFQFISCNLVHAIGEAHNVQGKGFGNQTTGGTGGALYFVSNLNDGQIGSLRNILETSNRPAIIKFLTCDTIELNSRLVISRGNLTIDGSDCAGGFGIQIKNYPVSLQNIQNVILSNIGLRHGTDASMTKEEFSSSDPLEIQCSQDIVINHLSIYWGTDENISIYCYETNKGHPSTRISIQHSIIAEALRTPKVLSPRIHSMGVLIDGKVNDVTFYGNLFASNADRNPLIAPNGFSRTEAGTTRIQFINNMIYQTIYGLRTGDDFSPNWLIKVDLIGNFIKQTSNNYQSGVAEKALFTHRIKSNQPVIAYLSDNLGINRTHKSEPEINVFQYSNYKFGLESVNAAIKQAHFQLSEAPLTDTNKIPIIPAQHLESFILANAGKLLPFRDPIDQKVIDNIKIDRLPSEGGQQAIDEPNDYMIGKWQCFDKK